MAQERIDELEKRVERLEENSKRKTATDNKIILALLAHLREVDPDCAERINQIIAQQ